LKVSDNAIGMADAMFSYKASVNIGQDQRQHELEEPPMADQQNMGVG
jgi:hypothetical protein